MSSAIVYSPSGPLRIGIINFFIFIGLLRLTNFNFYMSQLVGLETEINNTGGNAFNFINYLGVGFLLIIVISKLQHLRARWWSARNIFFLMGIYGVSAFMAPYTNHTWVLYQELFLVIALLLHLYVQKVSSAYVNRFRRGLRLFFWMAIGLVFFCTIQIVSKNALSYYLSEFNEVFVQTLDDYGIMKQRYGYLLGFLVSYILFIIKGWPKKVWLLTLILLTGFGIRSFVLGMLGAGLIFSIKSFKELAMAISVILLVVYFYWGSLITSLIYDTRFYSFVNAYDIVQHYPFGVGLGGYQEYTEVFSRQLYAAFFNVSAILDYIPVAPESDLVHLFGSLGLLLATVHLFVILRIVYLVYKFKTIFNSFQKCILFYFCFMTFFGISEDSMFSINYWIFFGLASGIVASRTNFKMREANG